MILNRQRRLRIPLRALQEFERHVCRELGLPADSMTICFITDAGIARMNREFRRKEGPTDVLSFPETAWRRPLGLRRRGSAARGKFLGDVAIAPAVAQRYARKHGRTLSAELRVLILHGALHLLGYDHETDRGQMERIEARLRRRLGIA